MRFFINCSINGKNCVRLDSKTDEINFEIPKSGQILCAHP